LYNEHIVGIHDRGEYHAQLWISMDYVEGTDAAQLLRQYPSGMPKADVVEIISAVPTEEPAHSFRVPNAVTAGNAIDVEVIRRDRISPAVFRREWPRAAIVAANGLDVAAG
jgi:hypothetical protein